MTSPLDKALQRLAELQREMDEVRQFIELYHRFDAGSPGTNRRARTPDPVGSDSQLTGTTAENLTSHPVENSPEKTRKGRPAGSGPREIAEIMERVIREADRPLSRGEIVDALERREIEIPAQDKARYVGTIAWRNKGKFVNIEGRGYWLRGSPLIIKSGTPIHDHPFAEDYD